MRTLGIRLFEDTFIAVWDTSLVVWGTWGATRISCAFITSCNGSHHTTRHANTRWIVSKLWEREQVVSELWEREQVVCIFSNAGTIFYTNSQCSNESQVQREETGREGGEKEREEKRERIETGRKEHSEHARAWNAERERGERDRDACARKAFLQRSIHHALLDIKPDLIPPRRNWSKRFSPSFLPLPEAILRPPVQPSKPTSLPGFAGLTAICQNPLPTSWMFVCSDPRGGV